jgi:hypothetical protein
MARLDKLLTGHTITDEYFIRTGSTALGLIHDTIRVVADLVIRTAAGGGGTLLSLSTDYTVSDEDTVLTAEAGVAVYRKVAIVNGTYQNVALYASYKTCGDYAKAQDVTSLMYGKKIGLQLSYVSSNVLSLSAGSCHINSNGSHSIIEKLSATSITSATTNWPGVGAGAYVTIDNAGVIRLRASTCTASTRPSDNFFQLTGGGVGYNDIGKFGYYYSATERIIAHFWEVSATSFYIINNEEQRGEYGTSASGRWSRKNNGELEICLTMNNAVSAAVRWNFPTNFSSADIQCTGNVVAIAALFPVFATPTISYVDWGSIVSNAATLYAGIQLHALVAKGIWY